MSLPARRTPQLLVKPKPSPRQALQVSGETARKYRTLQGIIFQTACKHMLGNVLHPCSVAQTRRSACVNSQPYVKQEEEKSFRGGQSYYSKTRERLIVKPSCCFATCVHQQEQERHRQTAITAAKQQGGRPVSRMDRKTAALEEGRNPKQYEADWPGQKVRVILPARRDYQPRDKRQPKASPRQALARPQPSLGTADMARIVRHCT